MFKKLVEKLYFAQKGNLALYDQFTGCLNRNWYNLESSKYNNKNCYVTVVDINGLKKMNDTKGHQAGDLLISSVANTLLNNFKKDVVCRFGGDEFIVISKNDPSALLQSIHATSSFSFGTVLKDSTTTLETAFNQADERMYSQKVATKQAR